MALVIEIPDEAVQAMRIPPADVERELKKELAVALYARGALSIGKATEMAGATRRDFEAALASRHIERPYNPAEVERDLAWANGSR